MNNIITTLVMFLMMVGASFGAVSEDMSIYVRKDVYDANMQGINAKLDLIIEQMKLQREEQKEQINELRSNMKDFREEQKAQRKDINELSNHVIRLSERLDGIASSLSARIDGIDKRMDSLDKRIDDLRNGIYLWLVAIGLIIAWPKLLDKLHSWGKSAPSVTLEDVKRLIEEQIAKNNEELLRNLKA
ncbi:MAG: hypothetical protein IJ697_05055 [Synergistaceae bacterium]|nr:hypothetical protein [Synergistaceae bacterium]